MFIKLNENPTIENLGHCPAENVENLRELLALGAPAQADEKRRGFYELFNGSRVYWIHISPVNGHVMLLAVWQKPLLSIAATALTHQAA